MTRCNHVHPCLPFALTHRNFPLSSTIFRGSDRRIYRWRMANDVIIVGFDVSFSLLATTCIVQLAADSASSAPIAIAYDDAQPLSTVDPLGASVVLCIQPSGFHLLHEVVATFVLFEQLRGKTRVNYTPNTRVAPSLRQGQTITIISIPVMKYLAELFRQSYPCWRTSNPSNQEQSLDVSTSTRNATSDTNLGLTKRCATRTSCEIPRLSRQ